MEKNKPILIIEDDPNIIDLVEIHLKDLGYELDQSRDGQKGLQKALDNSYSLIILDLMLPGMDGLEICKRVRSGNEYTPILMLTAKSEELDKVLGLELGADEYITKPFSIRELIARVKAIFRRMEVNQEKIVERTNQKVVEYADLTIDFEKRKVTLSGKSLDLTTKEFDLLALFAQHPGRTYSRNELLDKVWGYQFSGYDHTVNSHINRLRAKIEKDPSNPVFIKTVWGYGYRFVEAEELSQ